MITRHNAHLDVQDLLIPLRRPSPPQGELPERNISTRRNPQVFPRLYLEDDVLLQHQGPFQLRSDRNKALHDLLDILISMFARVRKRDDGTVYSPKFPGCGREGGSLILAQCGRWRKKREYATREGSHCEHYGETETVGRPYKAAATPTLTRIKRL